MSAENVEKIQGSLPNLQSLSIKNDVIKVIPFVERLKELYCGFCKNLESITATSAIHIVCYRNEKLKSLFTLQAEFLNCDGCSNITSLVVPGTLALYCDDCTNLTSISAPLAMLLVVNRVVKT